MQGAIIATAAAAEPVPIFGDIPAVKARYPGEGRRKWRLRVADAFWTLTPEEKAAYVVQQDASSGAIEDAAFVADDDPFDELTDDAPGLGVLVRADYTDEDAWQAFYGKLQEGEAEFAAARPSEEATMAEDIPADSAADDDAMDEDEEGEEEEEEEEEGISPVFFVINAPLPDRARFSGTKRIKPPNRLVDHDGWQEIYTGKIVWIYDARSNRDQCVRLVSQQSGPYGTATADSWRVRVSHICELQVNLALRAMTIDFGGLDRWDYDERVRNMEEASRPI